MTSQLAQNASRQVNCSALFGIFQAVQPEVRRVCFKGVPAAHREVRSSLGDLRLIIHHLELITPHPAICQYPIAKSRLAAYILSLRLVAFPGCSLTTYALYLTPFSRLFIHNSSFITHNWLFKLLSSSSPHSIVCSQVS